METTTGYRGYIGIMERNMETTKVYWSYIGEKEMETIIVGFRVYAKRLRVQVQSEYISWSAF